MQYAYISADTIVENVEFGIMLLTLYSYEIQSRAILIDGDFGGTLERCL